MLVFIYIVVIFNTFVNVNVSAETAIEIEVSNHLEFLEEQTYFPIEHYIAELTTQLENLITNFSNLEIEATELIESYTQSIKTDVESIINSLSHFQVDTQDCQENIHENYKQILRTSKEDTKTIIIDGISKSQRVILEARNVFMGARNRTILVKLEVEKCMQLLDNSECLLEVLTDIVILGKTLPKIILVTGLQHQTQLELLEEDVVAEFQSVIVKNFDKYMELLDEFLVCAVRLS